MQTKLNHDALLTLEQPVIKVPFEQLRKAFRTTQRSIEKDLTPMQSAIGDLATKSSINAISPEDAIKALDGMTGRVQTLKRKLNETRSEETVLVSRSKKRLDHLHALSSMTHADTDDYIRWSHTRLERILVDYMLRNGMSETATQLANDEHLEELVDIGLFAQAKRVEEALKNYSCTECLQWCSENKSALRKMKSTLEFNLRMQEYIELVRAKRYTEAMSYLRKHLAVHSDTHLPEIQQASGLLAFGPLTSCGPYKRLYDISRWNSLVTQFRKDNCSLHSLTGHPLLAITLSAGLSALKTAQCYQDGNKNLNCPVCSETLGELAKALPLSHHVNSTIVCRITGEIMDEDNPPMALPNGMVYSAKALHDMAARGHGKVTCPRTLETYEDKEARKVYIS